jgi:hypothetical protein
VLQTFHSLMRRLERRRDRGSSVVRHQKTIMFRQERLESIGQRVTPRRGVRNQRYFTKLQDNFRQHGRHERLSRHRESRGGGRMRVDDRANVGTTLVDPQVHAQFAGGRTSAFPYKSFEADDHQVVRRNIHLGEPRWRDDQRPIVPPNGHVAIRSRNQPALV